DSFGDGQRLEFLSGIRVEDDDVADAAADEQSLVGLVERHGDIVLAHSNGPRGGDGLLPAVDGLNLSRGLAVDVHPRAEDVEGQGFESFAIDADLPYRCGPTWYRPR